MSCSSVRTIVNRATPSARRSISSSASSSLYRGPTHPQTVHSDGKSPKPLRMLFFGKPGAGKGTLSARMVAKYDVIQLSTGDLLRSHIAERTEVGKAAEAIVARGGLLPDDIMTRVITSKLDTVKHRNWILDGFPRTLGQGKLLQEHLLKSKTPLTLVVNIEVPDKIILDRIGGRWVHLPSGRVYNTQFNPPKVPGRDDITGEELIQRPDDNPEVFAKRLKAFYESTAPLLSFYSSLEKQSNAAKLVTIAGNTSDEIWPQLEAILVNDLNMKPRTQRASSVREAMIRDASRMPQQQQNPLTNLSMTK